jgi:hypothetical protein
VEIDLEDMLHAVREHDVALEINPPTTADRPP